MAQKRVFITTVKDNDCSEVVLSDHHAQSSSAYSAIPNSNTNRILSLARVSSKEASSGNLVSPTPNNGANHQTVYILNNRTNHFSDKSNSTFANNFSRQPSSDQFLGRYSRLMDSDNSVQDFGKASSSSKIVFDNMRYTVDGHQDGPINPPTSSSSQHKNVESLLSAAEKLRKKHCRSSDYDTERHYSSSSVNFLPGRSPLQKFLGQTVELTEHLPKIGSADDDDESSNTSSTLGAMEGPSHAYHNDHVSHISLSHQDGLGDGLTFSRMDLEGDCSENQEEAASMSVSKFDPYPYPPPEYKGRPRKHPYVPGKYPCHYCGWRCAKPSVLKKHIRSHTNERPYPCKYCNISFKTKSNLSKHEKSKGHMSMMNELKIQQNTASQATEDVALLCRRLEETEAHKGTFTRQDALLEALTRGSRSNGERGNTSPVRLHSSPVHQPLSPTLLSRTSGSSAMLPSNVALSPYEYNIESSQMPSSGILQYQDDNGVIRHIRVRIVRETKDESLDWGTIVQSDDIERENVIDITTESKHHHTHHHLSSNKHDYLSRNGTDDLYSPQELVEVDEAASEDIIHEEDVVCVNEVEVGLGGREHSSSRMDGCDSGRNNHRNVLEEDIDDSSVYDVMQDDPAVNIFEETNDPPMPSTVTLSPSSQSQKNNLSINEEKCAVTPSKQLRIDSLQCNNPSSPRGLRVFPPNNRTLLKSPHSDSAVPSVFKVVEKRSPLNSTSPMKRLGGQMASPNVNAYLLPQDVPVNLSATRSRNHFVIDSLKEEEEVLFNSHKAANHRSPSMDHINNSPTLSKHTSHTHRGIPVDILSRIDRAITSKKNAVNTHPHSSSNILVKDESDDTLEEIVVVDDEDIPLDPDDEDVSSEAKSMHPTACDRNDSRANASHTHPSSGSGLQLRDDKAFCAHCDQWMDIGRMKTHLMTHKLAGDVELSYLNITSEGKNTIHHSSDDSPTPSTVSRAGPRQFQCGVCNIGFRQVGHLNKHYRSKTHLTALCKANHLTTEQMNQLEQMGSQLHWDKLIDCSSGILNQVELKRLLSPSSSHSPKQLSPTKTRNLRSTDATSPVKKK